MAPLVLTDCKVYLDGYNLSGSANELDLSVDPEALNSTVFGMTTVRNTMGLWNIKGGAKGFLEFNLAYPPAPHPTQTLSIDSILQGRIGASAAVFSAAPLGNAENDVAYSANHVNGKYTPVGAAVGNLLPFALDIQAVGTKLGRGVVGGLGTKTVTGNSAAGANLGALSAAQYLFGALHVVAAAGSTPTLNVVVESATSGAFSSPTTRLTFPQFTASVGSSWQQLIGPITDTWFRMKWTISGSSPQYTIFGVFGIIS